MLCICGSQKTYEKCCQPYVELGELPLHAESLMRSRYTAYAMGNAKYLVDTTSIENRYEDDIALIKEYAQNIDWVKLDVLKSTENDDVAMVEFKAYHLEQNHLILHHEKSDFIRKNGVWFYDKGVILQTKIGRNESCACGSGKKYKQCHARFES